MRAVVLDANGQPGLADLPDPPEPGVLVRVVACGLCGSDVEKLGNGHAGAVLGHEVTGVTDDGTRVTVMHRVPCGVCPRCRGGHESTCDAFRDVQIQPGGFAERLRASHPIELPDALGELDGVWVEPLACVLRGARAVPRGRVLVVGCGAVGQLWVQVLLRRGDDVIVVDLRDDRSAQAERLGATVDETSAVDAAVVTAHGGVGDALDRLEPGGTLVVFAAAPKPTPVPLDAVYRKELRVVGSRSATGADFHEALALLPTLRLPDVTVLPFERFAEGVDLYRRGVALKVVFTP